MINASKAELTLVETNSILSAAPAQGADAEPEHVRAALRRCHAAWQRAYKAELDRTNGNEGDDVFAAFFGGKAYRKAMPIISSLESIQAYIACAAHGILIGVIQPNESGQVLYAAQVALGVHNYAPKSRKGASA